MNIKNFVRSWRYYRSRGLLSYYLCEKLVGRGLMSRERMWESKAYARFCKYFEDLPVEDYEKEMREQNKTVLYNNPNKYKDNPETFNEKIQWLKVHDTTPLKTRLADKYLVRQWIAEQIGEEYLIPLVGGPWTNADDIDFDKLPDRFALKANHGSGMNLIVKDKSKLDLKKARRTANAWLHIVYGCIGMEAQYFHIPRVLIAEKYMEDESGGLTDYKIHCFDGVPKIVQVIGDRDFHTHKAHEAFFEADTWKRIGLMYHTYDDYEEDPAPSPHLDEMLKIARKLSKGFIYVRVDLYVVNDHVQFGEMTFTPAGGYGKWGGGGNGVAATELILPLGK